MRSYETNNTVWKSSVIPCPKCGILSQQMGWGYGRFQIRKLEEQCPISTRSSIIDMLRGLREMRKPEAQASKQASTRTATAVVVLWMKWYLGARREPGQIRERLWCFCFTLTAILFILQNKTSLQAPKTAICVSSSLWPNVVFLFLKYSKPLNYGRIMEA